MKLSSIAFVIHNDPQLISGWAHRTTVLRNIASPSNPHFSVRYLPKILNFTTDMTSKRVTYRLRYRNYETPRTCVRLSTASLTQNIHECLLNQEVADSRMLRNSLTSLSPFPFKACSERIIDFYCLALKTFPDEKFWPPF